MFFKRECRNTHRRKGLKIAPKKRVNPDWLDGGSGGGEKEPDGGGGEEKDPLSPDGGGGEEKVPDGGGGENVPD
ncbi:MAG: hypothetical protein Greene071436_309 [Parcubacteria group bacterium Greene0714_36]|nr:MAG: hypothetical protein Greene071436_309 [Parcubacteria group bacterium Greene0714_36]